MHRPWYGIATLALLAACTTPPIPGPHTPATSAPASPASPTARTPTLSSTPSLTPSPEGDPTASATPTPPSELGADPVADVPDELWGNPPPRPHPRTPVNPEPPRRVPNAVRSFWVADPDTGGRREIDARLRVQTAGVAMWVEVGVWHDIRRLDAAAELFETRISPAIRAAFGSEWLPGIDNNSRVHVLHAVGLGHDILGYTSSVDAYPRDLHPLSNEAKLIVLNLDQVEIDSPAYSASLARQFQRLVQWNQDRNEERWLKEALAELGASLSGFAAPAPAAAHPRQTDVSLVHWTGDPGQREAVRLFAAYFHQQFGDEGTRLLTAEPANGIVGINATLDQMDTGLDFEDLFASWLAANYLDHMSEPGVEDPRLSYVDVDVAPPTPAAVPETFPMEMETTVQQFGADYIVLQGDVDLSIRFEGRTQTPLLNVASYSGQRAWWSYRADESLTTLTGRFDLTAAEEATLSYRIWYDIESDHDYATVAARAVDDEDWQILITPSGTDTDPHGNSPGWSYTGQSGGWLQEEVDLSVFAGEEVLVRFSYLTDGAITGEGFLLDTVSIPETGFSDEMETESNVWEAQGFLLIGPSVPQRYLALLISLGGEETTVERLSLDGNQSAEWSVPLGHPSLDEAVLVISGMAPLTTHPASYRLAIDQ